MEPWIRVILVLISIWCAMMWGFGAGKYHATKKNSNLPVFERTVEYWITWSFMIGAFVIGLTAVLA